MTLNGDVKLVEADGFTARTEHATYDNRDGMVRAPGPVEFFHGRLSGSGTGMTYDKNTDALTIVEQATLRVTPDAAGRGATDVTSGTAVFARREKLVRFDRGVRVERGGQVIDADNGVAHLTADEKRIDTLELHGNARIDVDRGGRRPPGAQRARRDARSTPTMARRFSGRRLAATRSIQLAGEAGKAGRQITANSIDVTLAPDGSTPTALVARDAVQLTLPAESGAAARTVKAATLDADGEPGRGLTKARFTGSVEYREKSATLDRLARSARLDVGLKPGLSAFDQAVFSGGARFADAKVFGTAASVRYLADSGALDLTGSEPGIPVPHVSTDQITVDATHIEVGLGRAHDARHGQREERRGAAEERGAERRHEAPVDAEAGPAGEGHRRRARLRRRGRRKPPTPGARSCGRATRASRPTRLRSTTRPGDLTGRLRRDHDDARSGGPEQEERARADDGDGQGVHV